MKQIFKDFLVALLTYAQQKLGTEQTADTIVDPLNKAAKRVADKLDRHAEKQQAKAQREKAAADRAIEQALAAEKAAFAAAQKRERVAASFV